MHGSVDPLHLLAWLIVCVGFLLLFYCWYVRVSQRRRDRFLREYLARHRPYRVERYQGFYQSRSSKEY